MLNRAGALWKSQSPERGGALSEAAAGRPPRRTTRGLNPLSGEGLCRRNRRVDPQRDRHVSIP